MKMPVNLWFGKIYEKLHYFEKKILKKSTDKTTMFVIYKQCYMVRKL